MFSAMGWAGDAVLVRRGLRGSNIIAAMAVSYAVSIGCVWAYLLSTTSLEFLKSPAMIYFLISGCMQPLLARALFYEGITRIGVARAGPLRGVEPFCAAVIGVTFFAEQPGLLVYLGTMLIMASMWLISGKQSGDTRWRLIDSAFPVGAGLISAISQSLRKQGLQILPSPFVATATVTSTSLLLLVAFVVITQRTHQLRMERRSLGYFIAAALVAVSAQISNFIALGRGELSVIIPLLNTTPLFTLLLSSLFLRDVEKITPRIVVGATLMVAGVVVITSR